MQTMSEGEEPTIPSRNRRGGCKAGDNCKGIACNQCWSFKVSSKSITLKSKPKAMSVFDDDVPISISNEDDIVSSNSDVTDVATAPDEDKPRMSSGISTYDNDTKGTSTRVLSKTHLFNSISVSEEMKPIMLSLSTPEQVEKFRMETGLYQEEEGEEEDTPMNVDDTSTTNKSSKKKWWKKKNSTKSKIKAAADNGKIYESSNTNKQPLYTALDEYYDHDSDESKSKGTEKKEEQIVVEEDLDELKPDADTNGEEKKVEEEVRNNKDSSSLTSLKEYVVRESNTKDDTFCTSVAMALESGVEGGSSNIEDLLPPVNVHKEKIDVSSPPVKVSKTKRPKTKRTRENLSYMSLDDHYDNTSDDLSDNAVPPPLPEIFVSESRGVADEPTKLQDKEIKKEIDEVDITICEDNFLDHLIESIMEVKEKNIDYITGYDGINKDALTEAVPEVVSTCLAPSNDVKEENIHISSKETASDRKTNKASPRDTVLSRSKLIGNVNNGPSKKNSIKPFNSLNEGEAEAVEMIINETAVSTPPLSQSQPKPQKKTRLAMAREKMTRNKETAPKQEQSVPSPDVFKSITIIPAASTVLDQQDDIQAEDELSICPSRVSDTSKQLKRERLRAIMDKRKSGSVLNENKKPEEKSSPTELTEFKKLLTSKRLFNPVKSKAARGQVGAALGGDSYVETPEDRIKAALRLPADTSKDSNDEENVAPQAPIYPLNQVDVKPEEDNVVVSKLTTPTKDEGNGEKKKTSPLDSCGMMGIEIANDLKEAIIMPAKNLCTSEGIYPRWCFSDNADEQVVQEGDRQEVLVMWQPTNEETDTNQESNEPSVKPPTLAEKTLNSIFPKEENQVRSPSPTLTDISSESSSEDVNPEVKNVIAEALNKARLQKEKNDTKSAQAIA